MFRQPSRLAAVLHFTSSIAQAVNPDTLADIESIFRGINQAIWIVASRFGERNSGLTATWVHQASIDRDHPTVLIGLAPNHFTCETLLQSGNCMLHLLHPGQAEVAWTFARPSSRERDKFAGLEWNEYLPSGNLADSPAMPDRASRTSVPWLVDCHSVLACRTLTHFDAGDRVYFLARVVDLLHTSDGPFMRESDFFSGCRPDQLQQLKQDLDEDVVRQRPLLAEWLKQVK